MRNTQTVPHIPLLKLSTVRKVFSLLRPAEKWLVVILALLMCLALYWNWHIFRVSHTQITPTSGGSITEGMVGRPELINPLLASTPTDEALVHALFSGLYRYNGTGEVVPDLATDMPYISADEKQYTVNILPSAQWHDGTPLTAADVVFTIEQIKNEAVNSPHRDAWLSTSVEQVSDTTVVFTTKDVSGPFIHNLTLPLIPRHLWARIAPAQYAQAPYNSKPIGSGPFAFAQYKKDPAGKISEIALTAFDKHPRTPHVNALTFIFFDDSKKLEQAFINGDVKLLGDYTGDLPPALTHAGTTHTTLRTAQYQAAFFNQTTPALQELAVRKALRIAIHSAEVTRTAWNSAYYPISETPLGLLSAETSTAPADLERANQILETAGWKRTASGQRSKNGQPLVLRLYTNNNEIFRAAAELLAQQWKQLGVTTEIHALATPELITEHVRPRAYDVLLFSQRSSADADAFAFWHSSQSKDPGLNVANFKSTEADQLIIQGRTTTNRSERTALYNRLRGLLDTQIPAIYLNQTQFSYLSHGTITLPPLTAIPDPSWRTSFLAEAFARTARTWK